VKDKNIKKCIVDFFCRDSRAVFDGILQYQINLYNRYYNDDKFCVVIVDIPDIKRHNSVVHDILKKEVGEFLLANTRNSDVVSTLTDDKFVILLTKTNHEAGKKFGEKIREFCSNKRFNLKIVGREYAGATKEEFLIKINRLLSDPKEIDDNDIIVSC
jgi:GGDEF domain-containing protein